MRTGLIVVGLGGVGSSLIAGVVALREKRIRAFGGLTETPDFELGAFELQADDAYCAAVRAGLVDRSLLSALRPKLRAIRAMTRFDDLAGFMTHHGLSHGIVVCTAPDAAASYSKAARHAGCDFVAVAKDKSLPTAGIGLARGELEVAAATFQEVVQLTRSGQAAGRSAA